MRVFHKSLNVAGETRSDARVASEGPRATMKKNASLSRRARDRPSPCILLADRLTPVGQDRLILTRSGSGDPELQRWARCAALLAFLSVFAHPQGEINTETEL